MTERDYRRYRLSERLSTIFPEQVKEAIVISNCKRVEIVVSVDASVDATNVSGRVVSMLEGWVSTWEEEKKGNVTGATGLSFNLTSEYIHEAKEEEKKGNVTEATGLSFNLTSEYIHEANIIPDYVSTLSGAEAVSRYLCLVAAGLPPESPMHLFSPYLSRDAHILKQLKQAFAAASSNQYPEEGFGVSMSTPPCRGRLGVLLRGCLEAGKAARDPGIPELVALRPFLKPSREDRESVAKTVCLKAVDPVVTRSVAAFAALDRGKLVCELIEKARCVVESVARKQGNIAALREIQRGDLSLSVRRELHEPMLALRGGSRIDEGLVLKRVAEAVACHTK
eukprot:CAMPEP_0113594604 /NCGR_PEP_ID=MMETSP0015_2-20120614/39175_1 /TAXON_ID=2838 /ORGANISM="Odontella" /LENGTH=337 /DNA_ID=CAMNT_0000501631 /DNA_START=355 /DNA_END=1365 /DNA_ORIENTATION=+ /assembly_acc=CAM_ASM_000160